jgi:hypothetical protein
MADLRQAGYRTTSVQEGDHMRRAVVAVTDSLQTTYESRTSLPEGATDTGFRRDGRQLWLAPEAAAYLVSLQDRADVERWPAARDAIGCA